MCAFPVLGVSMNTTLFLKLQMCFSWNIGSNCILGALLKWANWQCWCWLKGCRTIPKQMNFRKSSEGGGGVILNPKIYIAYLLIMTTRMVRLSLLEMQLGKLQQKIESHPLFIPSQRRRTFERKIKFASFICGIDVNSEVSHFSLAITRMCLSSSSLRDARI